jgi:hypothetical protein
MRSGRVNRADGQVPALARVAEAIHNRITWTFRHIVDVASGETEAGDLPLDWRQSPYNRTAVLSRICSLRRVEQYLEIGCDNDLNFMSIPAVYKVGVDPARGGTHRMTSDDFFEQNDDTFDLIFIDGLHEYSQVLRDIDNSLLALKVGGTIVVDDVLPIDWRAQRVPRSQAIWNGDVWKAIFEFKAKPVVDTRVVAVDHGIALLIAQPNSMQMDPGSLSISQIDFSFYREHFAELGIISYSEIELFLAEPKFGPSETRG